MAPRSVIIDFDAIRCDHLTNTGKGWANRLRELGAGPDEINLLVTRLREGMAAEIELYRIKHLAKTVKP